MSTRGLLVATATVSPGPAMSFLVVRNPRERLSEYTRSLQKWRSVALRCDLSLLVIESSPNTGKWAAVLREHCGFSDSEVVHLEPSERSQTEKGRSEAEMINLACSSLQADHRMLVKATGRLRIANAARIIHDMGALDEWWVRLRPNLEWADSRFFAVPAEDAFRLVGMEAEVDETNGVFLENVLARRTLRARLAGSRMSEYMEMPIVQGRSGSTGARYGGPLKDPVRRLAVWLDRHLLHG